jgi:hypothetical protein
MDTHKNARLTPHGRALLVALVIDEGLRSREVVQPRASVRERFTSGDVVTARKARPVFRTVRHTLPEAPAR